ncbi:MAG: PadR family transcriptional regulator [Deltaproteobacteria bacterium]|nr:PadR family transcriptional regulator [Deltaproteobacteria bacterium]
MKEDRHGYEIHHLLSSGLGRVWYAGMSQIYALLKHLEMMGEVISKLEIQDNRPAKKIYSITPEGREAFLNWVQRPVERIRDLRLQFLAKLFFMRELKLSGIGELMEKQIKVCQGHLEGIKQQDDVCCGEFDGLVFQFRICQIEAIIRWLKDCEGYFNH